MTNKAFSILLLFTLVFGGALGAAFAAGVALGKSQGPDPSQESAGLQTPRSSQGGNFQPGGFQGGGPRAGSDGQAIGFQGRQPGGREGGISGRAGESPALVEGGSGPDAASQAAAESEGVQEIFGRVDIIEDNVLTVTTFQGTVQVTLRDDTTIQKTVEGAIADLVEGANIRIVGRPDQEGNLQARSITLLAEDLDAVAAGRGDFGRIAPVMGTIISVEEGLLTVDSPEGPVRVAFQAETTIQKTTDGALSDLVEGMQVRVTGVSGEAGAIVAQSLTVVPGDAGRPFGRRGNRGIQ